MSGAQELTYDILSDLAVLDNTPLVAMFEPNAGGQDQFSKSRKHQRILSGANNSGKTYAGLMEVARFNLPELDIDGNRTGYALHPNIRIKLSPEGSLGWVSSYSQDVQFDTIQPLVHQIFDPYKKDSYSEEGVLHWFETDTGRINFKWQTQGWESYRGPKLDYIHLDEPHSEIIYNECIARLFKKKGYMWTTLTPVVDIKARPSRIRDVIWMLKKLVEPYMRDKTKFPELEIIFIDLEENSAYVDTGFVRNMLAGVSEEEYIIRTTGKFIILIGTSAFSERRLDKLQSYQALHPEECVPEYGTLHYNVEGKDDNEDVYFEPSAIQDFPDEPPEGFIIRIWQRPIKEQLGVRPNYHIGADLAEGDGGAYTAACVKREDTKQTVASLHGYMDEEEAARQLNLLGRYYRSGDGSLAKLAIEVNSIGKTSMAYLLNGSAELGIKKYDAVSLYQRPSLANLHLGLHIPGGDYGWYTSSGHRHFLLSSLRASLAICISSIESGGPCLIPDTGWTSEARTWVKDARGKYDAAQGFYDDRLIASAIADMSIEQGVFSIPVYQPRRTEIREPECAFRSDPDDPRGERTILNMAEIRRRASERAKEKVRASAANYYR